MDGEDLVVEVSPRNVLSGRASWMRISPARTPPRAKKTNDVTSERRPMDLWSTLDSQAIEAAGVVPGVSQGVPLAFRRLRRQAGVVDDQPGLPAAHFSVSR